MLALQSSSIIASYWGCLSKPVGAIIRADMCVLGGSNKQRPTQQGWPLVVHSARHIAVCCLSKQILPTIRLYCIKACLTMPTASPCECSCRRQKAAEPYRLTAGGPAPLAIHSKEHGRRPGSCIPGFVRGADAVAGASYPPPQVPASYQPVHTFEQPMQTGVPCCVRVWISWNILLFWCIHLIHNEQPM